MKTVERVAEYIFHNPHATEREVMNALDISSATYYRCKKQVVNQDLKAKADGFRYHLPAAVTKNILPPVRYRYTHLVYYLAKFNHGDKVPPYNKTKAEIMFEVASRIRQDSELTADLIYTLQEKLAIYAMICKDTSMFTGSVGKLEIPDEY